MDFMYGSLRQISHLLLVFNSLSHLPLASAEKFSVRGPYAVLMFDRSCHQHFNVTSPDLTSTLGLAKVDCSFSFQKECSVTYDTSEFLSRSYTLCGYFNTLVVNDCKTSIKMSHVSEHNADDFKTLTCNSKPVKYCASERKLRISFNGMDFCLKGQLKIQLEPRYPNTVLMNSPKGCISNLRIHTNNGSILSQRDAISDEPPNLCKVPLMPREPKPRFCIEFVSYVTGADIQIDVDNCQMGFGHGRIPSGKVCQSWSGKTPVWVNVVRGKIKFKDPLAHFYLFHYSFEKENDDNDHDYCGGKEDDSSDGGKEDDSSDGGKEDDSSDELKPYLIALIVIGVICSVCVLISICLVLRLRSVRQPDVSAQGSAAEPLTKEPSVYYHPSSHPPAEKI